jgi:UDP:flavonoid glycosyltransferase YjiC (YdhE family)
VLFVTANGVGLGHITRLSAIARRLPDRLEPVFATMSQAASVLEQMGFPTELLTTYNGKAGKPWNTWTRERMRDILDYHQPAALVLDASNPYEGVVEAAACRPDLKLVWVRRGMWRATQDNSAFLARAPYFDLIIEPDDIAAALDVARLEQGPSDTLQVPPIGLLEESELLPRADARRALGLPETAAGGSVLVQLGSGTTRDLNRLLSQVFEVLHCFPGLEIVLAQWLNTADEYRGRWRDVRLLTGFPIPRYYRAFDFTISAAGYNSFNDLLRFGIPTIFIANDAECMDDQGARARYAEAENAAFDIDEANLESLYDCVQAILQPPVRDYLTERARALARPNGAKLAARAIARLLA